MDIIRDITHQYSNNGTIRQRILQMQGDELDIELAELSRERNLKWLEIYKSEQKHFAQLSRTQGRIIKRLLALPILTYDEGAELKGARTMVEYCAHQLRIFQDEQRPSVEYALRLCKRNSNVP